MDDDKKEEEWKSTPDRLAEALNRFLQMAETKQKEQDVINYGFSLEVSAAELAAHLNDRAHFYTEESALREQEGPPLRPPGIGPRRLTNYDGTPREMTDAEKAQERELAKQIYGADLANLRAKARNFSWLAKHLPKGKTTFVLGPSECTHLELTSDVSSARMIGPGYGE